MRTQKTDLTICQCGCNQQFYLYDNRGRKRKYIAKHRGRWQKKLTKGEKISLKQKGQHHSPNTEFKKGNKSWSEGLFGKANPLWKENKVTPLKKWLRHTAKYIAWHHAVLERDNYTCVDCDKRGGKLHVDHDPKTFAEIINQYGVMNFEEAFEIEELFNIDNGKTRCELCHRLTSSWGGRNKRKEGFYARSRPI